VDFTQGTIADYDQLQAEGLKRLRKRNLGFFLAVLDEDGTMGVIFAAPGGGLGQEFVKGIGNQVLELIEEHDGDE
jgi:hypothetical protein